jgi:hypothetical protein
MTSEDPRDRQTNGWRNLSGHSHQGAFKPQQVQRSQVAGESLKDSHIKYRAVQNKVGFERADLRVPRHTADLDPLSGLGGGCDGNSEKRSARDFVRRKHATEQMYSIVEIP